MSFEKFQPQFVEHSGKETGNPTVCGQDAEEIVKLMIPTPKQKAVRLPTRAGNLEQHREPELLGQRASSFHENISSQSNPHATQRGVG